MSVSVDPSTVYSHPLLSLDITQRGAVNEIESIKITLPPGFVGAPAAVPQCTDSQASSTRRVIEDGLPLLTGGCREGSRVGTVSMTVSIYGRLSEVSSGRIYNGVPGEDEPGKLLVIVPLPEVVEDEGEDEIDGGVLILPVRISLVGASYRVKTEISGIPDWASSIQSMHIELNGDAGSRDEDRDGKPEYFLTAPASCMENEKVFDAEFSGAGRRWTHFSSDSYRPTECWPETEFVFSPNVLFSIGPRAVESPSGLYSRITQSPGEVPMKKADIYLPLGFKTNASAQWIEPCLSRDIWSCTGSSRIGYASAATPLIDRTLSGTVHLTGNTDGGTRLDPSKPLNVAMLLSGPVRVGLRGVLKARRFPSAANGPFQIWASFRELPELPINDFQLRMFAGPNALLKNPSTCGEKEFFTAFRGHHNPLGEYRRPKVEITGCDRPRASRFSPSLSVPTGSEITAGSHPHFQLQVDRAIDDDPISSMKISLPPGLAGSPDATAKCPRNLLDESVIQGSDLCRWRGEGQPDSQVGSVRQWVRLYQFLNPIMVDGSVYNIEPRGGEQGRFAILVELPEIAGGGILKLEAEVRLREDYGIDIVVDDIPTEFDIYSLSMSILGFKGNDGRYVLTAPSSCGRKAVQAEFTNEHGDRAAAEAALEVRSCQGLPYSPRFDVGLNPANAGSVTDLTTTIRQGPGEAANRRIKVSMPPGLTVNSLARGMRRCPPADAESWACGEGSRIGEAEAVSPLTIAPLTGYVNLVETPDGEPMRIAVLLEGMANIRVRVEGEIKLRPGDLGVDVEFKDLPDLPLESMRVEVKGLLLNPAQCGTHTFRASFLGHNSKSATGESSVNVDRCDQIQAAGLSPSLAVSADDYRAGANPRLKIAAAKRPGDGHWDGIHFKLPRGLAGNPFSVPQCTRAQEAHSSCPAASELGTVKAKIQITEFINPLEVAGKIYNGEAVGGDPAGFIVCMDLPPLAGGGKLCTRTRVNLRTSDYGIDAVVKDSRFGLFDIREIETFFDGKAGEGAGRPFLTNPSICSEQQLRASFSRPVGAAVEAEAPYTATECGRQNFAPGLNVTHSSSKIGGPTSIKTTITNSKGDATLEKINLLFPKELKIDVLKLKSCSPAQRQSGSCPAGSHLGKARIETPYLNSALEGDLNFGEAGRIYFNLDGLVKISLDGQIGIDQKSGALSFTMSDMPPLLVSRAEITLDEDKVKNPKDCAKATYKATFTSHSGKTSTSQSTVDTCGKEKAGGPTFGFKAKLKPKRKNRYTNATFTLTQKGKGLKAIRSLNIMFGKGKRALRVNQSALKRKSKAIGVITLKPEGAGLKKAKLLLKRGKVVLRGVKGLKLKLKGKTLKLTGLPQRRYERIVIKIGGRILRTPKAKGIVRFAATVAIPGTESVELASGVDLRVSNRSSTAHSSKPQVL